MDTIEVSTDVYLTPEETYDFLVDFPRYARYSNHLRDVTEHGNGGVGTEYELVFAWWKLSYTVRSRVTDVDPPNRIDWELTSGLEATGAWLIELVDDEPTTRVRFRVNYDPDSADRSRIDLPRFVSLSWVIERVTPLVEREAERIVERVVADLEGDPREVELTVRTEE